MSLKCHWHAISFYFEQNSLWLAKAIFQKENKNDDIQIFLKYTFTTK